LFSLPLKQAVRVDSSLRRLPPRFPEFVHMHQAIERHRDTAAG
jgi:hypothetical protein